MNIILLEPQELGKPLARRDARTIHLLKTLHKKTGDTFEAGVLGGALGTGRIEGIKLDGSLSISLDLRQDPPPRTAIRMAVGFSRPIQLRRILRDLAVLGLEAVDLVGTDLGEKSYQDTKLLTNGGGRAAMIEGAVQARDTLLPVLSAYPSLDLYLRERPWDRESGPASGRGWGKRPLLIAADTARVEGTFTRLGTRARAMVIAVGSERGWTDRERDLLSAAGFIRLSMGKRAMRTETAALAAAILGMEKIGELG
ncbi:MAG: RsmE family RNA methyltransferase [Treponema sp.]|jgi:RsmE family RNA methyltransferase|nr:RsmE family RNA methyltransferase [Treponema sp.]